MPRKKPGSKPDEVLRAQAEKLLGRLGPDRDQISLTEVRQLVHELHLHLIELDMQNGELRRAQGETEAACAKYANF